jgi:L-fuconolactonase
MTEEAALDPDQPIIDPHLHIWEILPMPGAPQLPHRFLFDEVQAMIDQSGQNITHSVYLECGQMYRANGPSELRSLGETEFVNGVAAMSASGRYGARRLAHRIVSTVDLRLGSRAKPVLEAHAAVAGERYRGVRMTTVYRKEGLFGRPSPAEPEILRDPAFCAGAEVLAEMDLSLDVWCLHTQLDEVMELADALPDLTIVLDHTGTPDTIDAGPARKAEVLQEWQASIAELGRRPNVTIKLGGLGMDLAHSIGAEHQAASSEQLAND